MRKKNSAPYAGRLLFEAALMAFVILFATVTAAVRQAYAQETERVKFSCAPQTAAQSVSVAGTFNDWNKDAAPMKETSAGVWETELDVPAGSHQYKFVINGSVWIADPSNPESVDDGHGGQNSVLNAGSRIYERLKKIRPTDDLIDTDALMHKPTEVKYIDFTANDRVRLTLRAFKNDLSGAYLISARSRTARFVLTPMKKTACDGIYDYYRAYLDGCDSRSVYLFKAVSGGKSLYFGLKGVFQPGPGDSLASNAFGVPDYFFMCVNRLYWWPDAVFYQIFPDRFRDGNRSLNQKFTQKWGSEPANDNFTGGDLAGITEKLGYVKELGANAIYLNPIFKSFSNHKYDTVDYFQIDPTLGSMADFKNLVSRAKKNGMRIILDGVFNHTSTDFFAFADVRAKGAKSKYADWYNFKSFPVVMQKPNYDCWWNIGSMPKLNIKNPEVYDYLLSVPSYWMKAADIDGFRLDVPEQLPHSFWKDFRRVVKSVKKDAFLVGEIWSDGSKWLAGDQFDSVMNYRLRNLLISFFVNNEIGADQFDAKLAADKINLPDSAFYSMFNLLGSHDTPRIATVCAGRPDALKNMIAFIMAYPGTPCVYYGDEIGLKGGKDPQNRRCMEWDETKWDREIFEFYKKAIAVRNENAELRRGTLYTYSAERGSGLYAFVRALDNSAVIAIFSNSKEGGKLHIDANGIYAMTAAGSGGVRPKSSAIAVRELMAYKAKPAANPNAAGFDAEVAPGGFALYRISFETTETR